MRCCLWVLIRLTTPSLASAIQTNRTALRPFHRYMHVCRWIPCKVGATETDWWRKTLCRGGLACCRHVRVCLLFTRRCVEHRSHVVLGILTLLRTFCSQSSDASPVITRLPPLQKMPTTSFSRVGMAGDESMLVTECIVVLASISINQSYACADEEEDNAEAAKKIMSRGPTKCDACHLIALHVYVYERQSLPLTSLEVSFFHPSHFNDSPIYPAAKPASHPAIQ